MRSGLLAPVLALGALALGLWATRVPVLAWRLRSASSAEQIRVAAQTLYELGGDAGLDAVERFAANRPDVAFDRATGSLMAYDESDHTLLEDQLVPAPVIRSGEKPPAFTELPGVTTKLHLRPGELEEIRLVDEPHLGPVYVVIQDHPGPHMGISHRDSALYEIRPDTLCMVRYGPDGPDWRPPGDIHRNEVSEDVPTESGR